MNDGDIAKGTKAAIADLPPDLKTIGAALGRLAKAGASSLEPYLHCVDTMVPINESNGLLHCHVIALDGNGRVRIKDLMRHLADNLLDYAIPRSKVAEAFTEYQLTGSSAKVLHLANQAKDLFVEVAKTGEGGELLLYLFAEQNLKLPQLLCKMDLKTSGNVHFHGSDGLHAGTCEGGKLALYWGESKIYKNFSSALGECCTSLKTLLASTHHSSSRDLQLLGRYMDLNDPELEEALKPFLNPSETEFNFAEFRGLCLVGFDSAHYPDMPNTFTAQELTNAVKKDFTHWADEVHTALKSSGISSYVVHVFCLPVPSAQGFRDEFLAALGIMNDSA